MNRFYDLKKASGGAVADAEFAFLNSSYVFQEKLDGWRIAIQIDEDGTARAYTLGRATKSGEPTDRTEDLKHILEHAVHIFPAGTVLDGEVVLSRACGVPSKSRLVASAIKDASLYGQVEVACFDILFSGGEDLRDKTLRERLEYLEPLREVEGGSVTSISVQDRAGDVTTTGAGTRPVALPVYVLPYVVGEDHKRRALRKIWKNGGEGGILKLLDSKYTDKRNREWVKVKAEHEYDVVFMGTEAAKASSAKQVHDDSCDRTLLGAKKCRCPKVESETKFAGLIGAIVFGQYMPSADFDFESGGFVDTMSLRRVGTTSGFDDALRRDITEDPEKYIGRVMVVTANEREPTGALRHPRFKEFREDGKAATECIFRSDES